MTPAREKAKTIIDSVPNREIWSTGKDADLFRKLTNTSHATMQADWDAGGIMTACNGWTGYYSYMLGRPGLGVFDLASASGDAWVPSNGQAKPKYGDVFRSKSWHVGVVMECFDTEWDLIEAGQGGKGRGYDILKRSRKPYDPNKIMGWVDIDMYLDPAELARAAIRKALKGTWNVEINGAKQFYIIAPTGYEVSYLDKGRKVLGSWAQEGGNIVMKWPLAGRTEYWPMPVPPLYQKKEGTWRDSLGGNGALTFRHAW